MIERQLIKEKIKEFQIQEYIQGRMSGAELSAITVKKTPLGDKITISSARPGMIVGKKGANIADLTSELKQKFNLENPQIEINEVGNVFLDASIVADLMVKDFENYGSMRFKQIGNKMVENIMRAGALGVEIKLSGKIPSARAKSWRFYAGYLKKSGEASAVGIRKCTRAANLKAGTIGIQVMIMPPELELPDKIFLKEDLVKPAEQKAEVKKAEAKVEETKVEAKAEAVAEKPAEEKPKKPRARKKKVEAPAEAKPAEEIKESAEEKSAVEKGE